ncbi:unnamed protein product [Acanthoscelides obtectus]|uniref:Uncharacterized protein n=1 Tax=Acanthoscelides obtectus TaxID=200917 RepID=A0A9P0NX34_ACAOB|nr:unnamed protein product [Acanthoscelides obtectus]CAK1621208.1 hypothetical protein AOBTE_LOCUS834 [Acanthoscelides obtectus]
MSRHTQILAKWLPNLAEYETLFKEYRDLQSNIECLINRCNLLLQKFNMRHTTRMNYLIDENEFQASDIEDLSVTIETMTEKFESIFKQLDMKDLHPLTLAKFANNRKSLWNGKLKLQFLIQDIIQEICSLYLIYGDSLFILAIRISLAFNKLYNLDKKYELKSDISICNNGCPCIMFPMRKFSVTRLLQIVALNRAELCCHKLIDCLLDTYKSYQQDDDDGSDSSSLEIYMTLTKHMTPHQSYERLDEPGIEISEKNENGFANLEELIFHEERRVIGVLQIILKNAPEMLGTDGVRRCKNTGIVKLNTKAQNKALEYYEQILWGEVSNYLEHVILWWASSPLAARLPHSSQHLREWIMQFIPTGTGEFHEYTGC